MAIKMLPSFDDSIKCNTVILVKTELGSVNNGMLLFASSGGKQGVQLQTAQPLVQNPVQEKVAVLLSRICHLHPHLEISPCWEPRWLLMALRMIG